MNIDSHILLPCPFCGQQPVAESTKNFHTVWCRNPECIEVRVCKFGDPEIAFGLWNRRACSDWKKLQAENERLREALEEIASDPLGMSGQVGNPKDNSGKVAMDYYFLHVKIAKMALKGGEK